MFKKYFKKYFQITNYQLPITGFTLIELLVVISIIGILVSFTASRYQTAEKQARDTKRKSDLNQYRVALENYSVANNSLYPTPVGSTCVDSATSLCDGTFKTNFLPSCPDDSRKGDTNYYQYCASGTSYTLNSMLETSGKIWQVCSVGQSCLTTQTTYQTTNACLCP